MCTPDYPTIMGFDPLVNQRLLPPTFPRYTVIHGRLEALEYVQSLVEKLLAATAILETTNIQEAFVCQLL